MKGAFRAWSWSQQQLVGSLLAFWGLAGRRTVIPCYHSRVAVWMMAEAGGKQGSRSLAGFIQKSRMTCGPWFARQAPWLPPSVSRLRGRPGALGCRFQLSFSAMGVTGRRRLGTWRHGLCCATVQRTRRSQDVRPVEDDAALSPLTCLCRTLGPPKSPGTAATPLWRTSSLVWLCRWPLALYPLTRPDKTRWRYRIEKICKSHFSSQQNPESRKLQSDILSLCNPTLGVRPRP